VLVPRGMEVQVFFAAKFYIIRNYIRATGQRSSSLYTNCETGV
jgi:hypothetical protein